MTTQPVDGERVRSVTEWWLPASVDNRARTDAVAPVSNLRSTDIDLARGGAERAATPEYAPQNPSGGRLTRRQFRPIRVKIPHERETADDDERAVRVREIERDEGSALVADLGPLSDDAELDVVDGTAIVVSETSASPAADTPGDDSRAVGRQIEIDLPDGVDPADVGLNNGVLTAEK